MSAETWPKESQPLMDAAWGAIDVVEHFSAAFVDALNNPIDERPDWPIERIAADASPDALAVAFAAWLNACAAVYQHPKATATP